jgi:PPP family 3-phenylpropionic acid transporter
VPFSNTPYWRLSGFYFFYFASLGVMVPYWSIYLDWLSFSASEIGELTAILLATRIFAPYLWGWLADHSQQRMRIVRITSFLSVLVFSAIFINTSYLWVATVMLLFSFFWNGSLPQFEVVTLQYLGKNSHFYSKIRLWGSIGFIIIVAALGWLLEHFNAGLIPYALLVSIIFIWLTSLSVIDTNQQTQRDEYSPISSILRKPEVIAFLVICFLLQVSHGPYYTFFSIYLEQYNYSRSLIGQLWALGVIAEVVVFLFMHRWLPSVGIKRVLLVSLLLTSLRWTLIALYPEHLAIIIFAQLLHAASFGSFHAAAIAWIYKHFKGKTHGRGQAIYSSVSFGAGGAIGSLYSGYMWLSPGPQPIFLIAAVLTFIATIIGGFWLNAEKKV